MVQNLADPETRYGASDCFRGDRTRSLFPLAAETQGVGGFDSPDLAAVWGIGRFTQTDADRVKMYSMTTSRTLRVKARNRELDALEDLLVTELPPREKRAVEAKVMVLWKKLVRAWDAAVPSRR